MDWFDYIYKCFFAFGIIYTIVSLLIGGIFDFAHIGHGHVEGQFHGHSEHGGHHDNLDSNPNGHGFWLVSPFKPIVIVSFCTVFGAVGISGTHFLKWTALTVLLLSIVSGLVISFLLYRFIVVPLYLSKQTNAISQASLIGVVAEVISPILKDGYGQITYTVNDVRSTAPAKHVDGYSVEQGSKVIICKIEDGMYYVSVFEKI